MLRGLVLVLPKPRAKEETMLELEFESLILIHGNLWYILSMYDEETKRSHLSIRNDF